jgi:hypothetical protein
MLHERGHEMNLRAVGLQNVGVEQTGSPSSYPIRQETIYTGILNYLHKNLARERKYFLHEKMR